MAAGTPVNYPDQVGQISASEPISQAADQAPSRPTRGIWVKTTGNIKCRLQGDTVDSLFENVPVGLFLANVKNLLSTANGSTAVLTLFVY